MNYENSWTQPGNLSEVIVSKIHFSAPTKKDKNQIFQVIDRAHGRFGKGDQDKFSMVIVDKKGKLVKDLGSHPSLDGAKKFAKNKGIIK